MSNKSQKNSEARSDDYPEITHKDIDRAVKRNGLKKTAKKPAEEVRYEIRLEDFDQHFEWLAKYLEGKKDE